MHMHVAPLTNKTSCIRLLKACKTMHQLQQIQAQVFTLGHHRNIDTLHKLMAFTTDPSLGNLNFARRIFALIDKPTLFIYNVMIKACTKKLQFKHALYLFDEMRVSRISPDNYTYPFVFKAIGGLRNVLEGGKVHGFVLKCGVAFDSYVSNSIMDMYGELGCVGSLIRVFDEMPERVLVSWNVLISGLVKCDRFENAIGVYRTMRADGVFRPDEATVVCTLSACSALKDLETGKEIHDYVKNEIGFSSIIGNALLDMYCKCGCLSEARRVFDALPEKNVICWTSMVSGYVSCGKLDEAKELFERSPARDLVLWTAMINGYVQFNCVNEAMALFREMQIEGVAPDKFTLVSLLTGCAQLGSMEQGEWIHGYIEENKIVIDAVVGTALIEMYAKCGCVEKSLKIFNGLKEKDTASWTSIICALAMNGKTSMALKLFSEMKRFGIRPDDITFIGVLSACSHGGLVMEGRQHFDSMINVYQIEPKLEHYGCLIDLLGRAGLLDEAEDTIAKIQVKENKIVIPLYGALLSACRIHGNLDMGERIAKLLMDIESSDSTSHTLLANIYASANRWDDVTEARKRMSALRVKKSPGCSLIDADGNLHEVGDASHPEINTTFSMGRYG